MSSAPDFSRRLAQFATLPEQNAVTADDYERLAACFLDWLGCAIAGAATPGAEILLDTLPRGAAEATSIGIGPVVDAFNTAPFNGFAGHALDFDDTEFIAETHPSTVILVVSDQFELVSTGTVTLSLRPRRDRATRRERRHGTA